MKKYLLILVLLLSVAILPAQKLIILHTNDIHSRILGFGPISDYSPMIINNDSTLGGFARLASIIREERKKNPDNLLVLDAGDFLMGTFFHILEPQTGFQLNLMKQIGYDAVTFGNHEYDFGVDALAQIVNSANKNGGTPPLIVSYFNFSRDNGDDKLQKLYDDGKIKPYKVIKKNGLKIGIFSVLGDDAIADVKNAAPLSFRNKYKVAKYYTKLLRQQEKVDIIICLSHTGVYPDYKGGFVGEDIDLAKKVKDIDIIISGHTHVETPSYIQVGKTIIVQTGCYLHNIGKLEIEYKNGKVNVLNFKLIPLDDKIKGDPQINKQVIDFEKKIDNDVLAKYNLKFNQKIAESDFNMYLSSHAHPTPSPLGNLVCDAMKYYVDNYADSTDIVLSAGGVIRENLMKGVETPADIFRIASLGYGENDYEGYALVKLYVTGYELRRLMELTIFSNKPGSDKYLYYSGLKVYYDPKGGFLHKVRKIEINGKPINITRKNKQLYSITTDTYIASFLGYIKKASHGLVKVIPKTKDGQKVVDMNKMRIDFNKQKAGIQEGKMWLAIIKYIETFKDTNSDGIPDIPQNYKKFNDTFVKM